MKRFLLTFLMVLGFGLCANAQTQIYKATSYAFANINQYTGRYTWGDWTKCEVSIVFDLQRDIVTIYSRSTQYYVVTSEGTASTDASGGRQVSYRVVDHDGDYGTLRLRIQKDGNTQLYIDFANVAWVYNVVRVQ